MGDETKIEPSVLFSNSEECRGLTSQIPETLYFGTAKVSLTCIEVSERFIAFGSDVGALFLFNRALGKFAKPLRTNVDEVINAVRIQSGETDVLAAGHKSGTVAVLRLPSSAPGANRKMQQHCLGDVHKGREVSCFDWSPDGSKLFSADSSGTVIMTMIDFENEVFHSTFVCAESSPIVQISYGLSRLAVSSEERSFVVDLANGCSIIQIGASSRSSQGKYGIVALVEEDTLKVVTSRPNCRLWVANGTTGHVDKTVIFAQQMKTAPLVCAPESLGSALDQAANDQPHCVELGYLKKLSNDLLVASDSRTISLVDLRRAKVLSKTSITSNELTVRSVCVDTSHGQSTVFVLLDKKHLLRLSDQPSPAEFINVPAPGVAASFLSGSFLPTKTSALLSKLKPPIVSRAKMDALPFGSTFGLESLFGSHKESFLKGSASTANAQRSQAESVENAIASMNEKLQIGESDSSSNAADKSSDEGEELLGRAGWRENVADAVNALVDHVGGAMTDVQTGEFVTGDMSSFTSSPNSIYAGSPLEPPKDDRVVVTRQHRMKRKHKNGKSRDSSVVGARSRSVTRSSGASTPMQELVNNENNEKNENIESKENTKNHENNVSES
uniref:Uncharacterized protein n=1 Tax=Plectus sambesii TaxID=2011161 RepID=A0A914X317_9BILA